MNRPHVSRPGPRVAVARPPRPAASVRLFCFPYAGGGSSLFRLWSDHVDEGIEVCPVLLPGREERFSEPPWTSMEELVPSLAESLAPWFDKPFAFFGHSLGGQIAFALSRYLCERGGPRPRRIFVSGCAPHGAPVMRHTLPDEEFLSEVRKMNGAPPGALDNPEIVALVLPTLRADFTLAETSSVPSGAVVPIPLTAFAGTEDPEAPIGRVEEWARHTGSDFDAHELQGDHFFLHDPAALLDIVGRRLTTDPGARPVPDSR
ncbi:thioesterase II family protein [Streptomyces sp. NPDC059452]|uniref:thioesterase II family protein n=1 Tax=Streptomyces sp. NPDC059452 TaxID=3346835 RepID=UPI0036943273